MSDKLQSLIDEMVAEKTFSGEAIQRVAELQKAASDMSAEIKQLLERIDYKEELINDKDQEISRLKSKINGLETRIEKANERAQKGDEAVVDMKVAQAESRIYNQCFDKVFRNQQIHRQVTSSVPVNEHWVDGNGGSFNNVGYHQQTEQIVEETK